MIISIIPPVSSTAAGERQALASTRPSSSLMIPGIPEAEIRSVGEFVGYLEKYCQLDEFLFRGQQQDWPLLPKIARLTPRGGNMGANEREMLSDLQRKALPWIEIEPKTAWEWLALAQHHGMATRLLDWSTNPLAALWFAVQKAPVENAPSVVWLQYHESIPYVDQAACPDPFAITTTQVFRPRHIAQRIVSQTAVFTAHARDGDSFLPAEQDYTFADCLTKLTVPGDAFPSIRWELDRCGLNAASIYPGLDGLCQHLEWLHSYEPDEGPDQPRPMSAG